MGRKLGDSVVVITGASSGIGCAAAKEFARRGATVVLAARGEKALTDVAEECRQLGARALAVSTDVTDEAAVRRLAARAIENFGRIDVWVNNAAVMMWGRLDQAPLDDYRRVIETDLFGYIYGARAVLPYFREQGSGVLINNASIVAKVSQPYAGPYVISKHGVRALGMNLRQELWLEGAKDIHVCTIMPATIDTPFFQHAANYTGRTPKPMPPVYPADKVAKTIVRMAERPRREVFVGNSGRALARQNRLAPGTTERALAKMTDKQHFFREKAASPTSGNLYDPSLDGAEVSGGWHGARKTRGRRVAVFGLAALALLWLRAGPGEE